MVKTELKLKKTKRQRKFIKDKAIANFLLAHMRPAKIDFSKIKIPSFLNFLDDEEKKPEKQNGIQDNQNDEGLPILGRTQINFFFEDENK